MSIKVPASIGQSEIFAYFLTPIFWIGLECMWTINYKIVKSPVREMSNSANCKSTSHQSRM
jgi:hypothetical protein